MWHQSRRLWCTHTTQWQAYVEELREASNSYLTISHDVAATQNAVQKAQGAVWQAWRRLLKEGTEKDFDQKFFIRKSDLTHICGLCGEKFMKTVKGKALAVTSKADFRRAIETLIGIRLTGNAMLGDADRDTIAAYEGAENTVKKSQQALEGYKRGKEEIEGLEARVLRLEAVQASQEALAKELGLSKEQQDGLLKSIREQVEQAKKDVKATKTRIDKANKVMDDKKTAYDKIMAKLQAAGLDA